MTILTVEKIITSSPRTQKIRCITPESTVALDSDDSDDDTNSIPHLLNPYNSSDQEDSDCEFEEMKVSTPYLYRRSNVMDTSPMASVSSLSHDGGATTISSGSKIQSSSLYNKKNKRLSFRLDDEHLKDSPGKSMKSSIPKLQLKPRMREELEALSSLSLSPIARQNKTTTSTNQAIPSPPTSSKQLRQKHRRSVSQPGTRNVRHESKLSTLKEGCESSDFDIPRMPIHYTPQVDSMQQNMHDHRRSMSLPVPTIVDAIGFQRPLTPSRVLHPYTDISPNVNEPTMIRIGTKVFVALDAVDAGSTISFDSYASGNSKDQNQCVDDHVKRAQYTRKGTSASSRRAYSEQEIALAWKNMSNQDQAGSNKKTQNKKKGKDHGRYSGSRSNGTNENPNATNEAWQSKEYHHRKERNQDACVLQ